ncbi:MAG TPA: glycosyltransferase, partial [Sphingomonas sp.]|nr:glycosyltransferase [Sphingomonas sp.]
GMQSGYPRASLREDCDFLAVLLRGGARLRRQSGRDHMVYVRHASNTWRLPCGPDLTPAECRIIAEPAPFAAARRSWTGAAPLSRSAPGAPEPAVLASCIMPTANRRGFVPEAIRQFLAQDYPNRELIIVDDGQDSIADLVPQDPSIRYYRLSGKRTLGAKRNLAVELARGEVIVHWDDDDWRSNRWIRSQVTTLLSEQADICGLDRVLFYEPATRRGWRYTYDGTRPWVAGGTLCYLRDHWRTNAFPDVTIGEDNGFVWSGRAQRVVINSHTEQFVATVHSHNTSRKDHAGRRWESCPVSLIEDYMRAGPSAPGAR